MLHFEVALACSDYRLVCLYRIFFIDAIEMVVTQCKCVDVGKLIIDGRSMPN